MADEMHFVDELPPCKIPRGNGKSQRFVEMLKTRPNQWAIYGVFPKWNNHGVYRLKFPGTEWTVRKNDEGQHVVYGCWIGSADNA